MRKPKGLYWYNIQVPTSPKAKDEKNSCTNIKIQGCMRTLRKKDKKDKDNQTD